MAAVTEREVIQRLHPPLPEPEFRRGSTALLVIDMQFGDAHRDYGLLREMRERGDFGYEYYINEVESRVIPNIRRLLTAFRANHYEVIHTRIASLTADGRDRSLEHKRLAMHFAPGSIEAEILPEVGPAGDEIVLSKTCGGVFNGTNLSYILRNLEIRTLVIAGVVASGCVEVAVRDAADLGYAVVDVKDATASWSPEMYAASMRAVGEIFAKLKSTDEVIAAIEREAQRGGIATRAPSLAGS